MAGRRPGEPGQALTVGALTIPPGELVERFTRSSGPGGQSVNTADSRVSLSWDVARSTAPTDRQRAQLTQRLAGRLTDGVLTVTASEHRAQLANRSAARQRLAALLQAALAPPPAQRRATQPSRSARQRRLEGKRLRGAVKAGRGRVRPD